MSRIIAHKKSHVVLGVLDRDAQVLEDRQSVTFADHNGTAHTVFAHVNGPFTTPEDIVKAHAEGVLHTFKSHDAAASFFRDYGAEETALAIEAVFGHGATSTEATQGRGL